MQPYALGNVLNALLLVPLLLCHARHLVSSGAVIIENKVVVCAGQYGTGGEKRNGLPSQACRYVTTGIDIMKGAPVCAEGMVTTTSLPNVPKLRITR